MFSKNFFFYFHINSFLLAHNKNMNRAAEVICLILLGVGVGFINGFLGAGGGMLLVPLIILILKLPTKVAHATAILIILPICVASGVAYIVNGAFSLKVFLPCLIGTIVGGVLGTFILSKLKNNVITAIFSVVMIAAGDILFDPIKETIAKRAMTIQKEAVEIVPAQLGNNAGVIGASLLINS